MARESLLSAYTLRGAYICKSCRDGMAHQELLTPTKVKYVKGTGAWLNAICSKCRLIITPERNAEWLDDVLCEAGLAPEDRCIRCEHLKGPGDLGSDHCFPCRKEVSCIVCSAELPDTVIGPTKCEKCLDRADANRRGVHGRGPQDWQRKVDAAVDDEGESDCKCVAKQQRGPYKWGWECRNCGRDMPAPEPDWDAMREARDER